MSSVLTDIAGVVHTFGTRHDQMEKIFADYWHHRPVQHERHGTRIAVIERAQEDCGEADGMLTDKPGLLLGIATADCAPVLLARKDGMAVAALHVGWRGAFGGIIHEFAKVLEARDEKADDWVAAIGPTAGPCCYEVSDELIKKFRERYRIGKTILEPRSRRLNLVGIVQWQLRLAGVQSISTSSECTICCRKDGNNTHGEFAFHSYRRDRERRSPGVDVQWSAIAISK